MPFLTLVVVNISIILKLVEIKKRKRKLTAPHKSTNQANTPLVTIDDKDKQNLFKRRHTVNVSNLDLRITFMVLSVVLAFFVFQSPYLMVRMIPHTKQGKLFHIIKVLSDFSLVLNFSVNFLIYCFFGQKFRTTAFEYLFKIGFGACLSKKRSTTT